MQERTLTSCVRLFVIAVGISLGQSAYAEYRVGLQRSGLAAFSNAAAGPAPIYEMRPSDNTTKNFFRSTLLYALAVFDTSSGAIIPNATITIASKTGRANTGGHDHDDSSRPTGAFSYLTGNTGPSGTSFEPTFTAPEISGIVDVVVTCSGPAGYSCQTTTLPIAVRISDLVLLRAGVDYILTGSAGDPGVTSLHVDNHFGVASFVFKLQALGTAYFLHYMNQPAPRLRFNDMSLTEGGLFDVSNNWQPTPLGHFEHRIGVSVDVDLVPVARRQTLKMMLMSSGITGTLLIHSGHWHVRESGSSQ